MSNNKEPVDRSRQHLANERTFLSWLRTSIALIGLGFIVARFGLFLREFALVVKTNSNINMNNINNNAAATDGLFGHYQSSPLIGITIIILGIALIGLALRNYLITRSHIENGSYATSNFNIFVASISLVFLGILVIVYLFAVLPVNTP
jgi:putative membrane protein